MFFDLKIFPPLPLPPLPQGERGIGSVRKIYLNSNVPNLSSFSLRTSIYSLSLDGRGLGRGCFV
jgi:hypothetical protein